MDTTASRLRDYRWKVWQLADRNDGGHIMNNDRDHAAIITEAILEFSRQEVVFLSGWLDETFYGQPNIVEAAQKFLERDEAKIRILVEEERPDRFWEEHNFLTNLPVSKIEVRQISQNNADQEIDFNFSVGDGERMRFEGDKSQTSAIAIFGDREAGDNLMDIFEAYWDDGEKVYPQQ